ncbi:MAG: hypothetical protein U0359_28880 [Byssovorax sp.]
MTSTAVVGVTGTVAGCADENDPATHVKRLSDAATRTPSVNRLIQFFEDAMTRDKDDRNGPTVKPLLDLIVQPMTETCVAGDLDERTNSKLIKFLSDTRDPRSEPCIIKALKDYKMDSTEDDVRSAARAVKFLKLKSAAGPLMEVFTKIRASKPKASTVYRDVSDAMIELVDPSWEQQLITYLGRPVDPKVPATVTDEMFWQITAAQVLGLMKSTNAVKPLIKVVLSPYKAAGAMTAIFALMKIGKPAIGPTVALLKGEDNELVEYSKIEQTKAAGGDKNAEKAAATAHIGAAALILATIGRDEVAAPLIEVAGKADDTSRAIIARELAKVPRSPATIKAFQEAFEKSTVSLDLPPAGQGAREVLLEAAGTFYDPSFVPWILKQAKDMKGEESDLEPIRAASLAACMKLATADQFKLLDDLYNTKVNTEGKTSILGKGYEKEFKLAKDVATTCGEKLDCYLDKLGDPASQKEDTQFQGIKAAYMIGELGNPAAREKIIDMMPKLTNGAVRFAAVSVVDFLSPKGDTNIASALQKIVDAGEASKDAEKIKLNSPFRTVIYRLTARAQ